MVFLHRGEAANSDPDDNSDALGVFLCDLQPRLAHRLLGAGHRVLDKEVHFLDLFFLDPVLGVKVGDLAGEPGWKARRVKTGYRANPRTALEQSLPISLDP